MTTEPTTRPEPWTVEELASIVERHAAHRYHCDGCVWIATLREARATLLDELEAAVGDITERHARLHTCSTKKVHADLRSVLSLIQQHREGNP